MHSFCMHLFTSLVPRLHLIFQFLACNIRNSGSGLGTRLPVHLLSQAQEMGGGGGECPHKTQGKGGIAPTEIPTQSYESMIQLQLLQSETSTIMCYALYHQLPLTTLVLPTLVDKNILGISLLSLFFTLMCFYISFMTLTFHFITLYMQLVWYGHDMARPHT